MKQDEGSRRKENSFVRVYGQIFCAKCSPHFLDLREFGQGVRGRLCHDCTTLVKDEYGKRKLSEIWQPGCGRDVGIAFKGNIVSPGANMDKLVKLLELDMSYLSQPAQDYHSTVTKKAQTLDGEGNDRSPKVENQSSKQGQSRNTNREEVENMDPRRKLFMLLSNGNFNPTGVTGLVRPSRYLSPWVLPPSGKELAWKHVRSSPFLGQKLLKHAPMEHPPLTKEEYETVSQLSTWKKRHLFHCMLRAGFSNPQLLGSQNGLQNILVCLNCVTNIAETVAPHVSTQKPMIDCTDCKRTEVVILAVTQR